MYFPEFVVLMLSLGVVIINLFLGLIAAFIWSVYVIKSLYD